jgi:hypothetical protein
MAWKWRNYDGILAKLIPKEQIKGLIKQDIVVRPGEQVVILRNGKIEDTVTQTRLEKMGGGFGNWLRKKVGFGEDLELLFVDTTETDIELFIDEYSREHDSVKGTCTLRVRVDPTKASKLIGLMKTFAHQESDVDKASDKPLAKKMWKKKKTLFGRVTEDWYAAMILESSDLAVKIEQELRSKILSSHISNYSSEDVRRNPEVREKMEQLIDIELRKTFEMWGLSLLNFYTTLEAGAYEELEQYRRDKNILIEKADIDSLPAFMEEIRGIDREHQKRKSHLEHAFELRRMNLLNDHDLEDITQERDISRQKELLEFKAQKRETTDWREHVQDMKELFGEPYLQKYGVPGVLDVKERMEQWKRVRAEHEVDMEVKKYQGTELASQQVHADVEKEKARMDAEKAKYNLETYERGMSQEQKRTSDTLEKSAKLMQAAKQNVPQTLVHGSSTPSTRVNVSDKMPSEGSEKTCPGCQKPVKSDWKVCPYCGGSLN